MNTQKREVDKMAGKEEMCKMVSKLPKDADVGECFTLRRKKRLITFRRKKPTKKAPNLKWQITSNKPGR